MRVELSEVLSWVVALVVALAPPCRGCGPDAVPPWPVDTAAVDTDHTDGTDTDSRHTDTADTANDTEVTP